MKSDNIRLTEDAKKQLNLFKEEQVRQLMNIIKNEKYYPGRDEVDVTASDIVKYSKWIVLHNDKKNKKLSLLLWSYVLMGVFLIFLGINYKTFYLMFYTSRDQLMIILTGVILVTFASIILIRNYLYYNYDQRYKEELNNQIASSYNVNNDIAREVDDSLVAFAENSIINAEQVKNKEQKKESLKKIFRLSFYYPDLLDEETRINYLLNLATLGDASDIRQLEKICNSETETERIKRISALVLEELRKKYNK